MKLRLFEYTDTQLLEPKISPTSKSYKLKINHYAREFLSLSSAKNTCTVEISPSELDHIASLHCDKWLEETGLHMSLYAGAVERPKLIDNANNKATIQDFSIAKYRNFSGDVSGVIGEAMFALLLIKHFKLRDIDFAHFGASRSTGIFPDFGIHNISDNLRDSFQNSYRRDNLAHPTINLKQTHLMPAEVKAMANPDYSIVKERLGKAFQQIRNFWTTRKIKSSGGKPIERGPSIIFLALRNPIRLAYDGVIIWAK